MGGVRSRLSRSPRRSPWDGITAGGASETPAAEPVSGLSALSPLEEIKNNQISEHISELICTNYFIDILGEQGLNKLAYLCV